MNITIYASPRTRATEHQKRFIDLLTQSMPQDIKIGILRHTVDLSKKQTTLLHLFGTWNLTCTRLTLQARKLQIPIIYSPFGALQRWASNQCSSSLLFICTIHFIKQVSTLHACSNTELQALKTKVPRNTALIYNPIITNRIDTHQALLQILNLYMATLEAHDHTIHHNINHQLSLTGETNPSIISICTILLYAKYQYNRGLISGKTLNSLAQAMTTLPYDENHMAHLLQKLHLKNFTARLQVIAEEYKLLTEGFMPIKKLYDKHTKQIYNKIETI